MKKILVVACLHGNETFGLTLARHISRTELAKHVDVIIGNPRAVRLKKRFIESDMNRSFNLSTSSYEADLAKKLKAKASQYKYVLDIHNTNTSVMNVPIVACIGPRTKRLIKLHPSSRVIQMSKGIARHSLIGSLGDGAVSFEYNRDYAAANGLEEMMQLVEALVQRRKVGKSYKEIYKVSKMIPMEAKLNRETDHNFKFIPAQKGYGVLTGENAYTSHQGFLAHKREVLEL